MELNLKNYLKKFEQLLPYESKVRNAVIKTFEELFPYIESDVKDFIYKEAGVDLEEKPLEEVA